MSQHEGLPFNTRNTLITLNEIRGLLLKYGVEDAVKDGGQYFKSMVHRSYCTRKNETFKAGNLQCPANCLPLQEESNERLEFLGDAVLNLIVADYLFERFPSENEGFLTRLRSKIVNGAMLAELSLMLGLDKYVIISKHMEDNDGRTNKKVMEDSFEAFLGAMYMSLASYDKTKAWFVAFLEANVDVTELVLTQHHDKDMLAKYFQQTFNCQPKYIDDLATTWKAHKFSVIVKNPKNAVVGTGRGATRKLAEDDAARAALRYFDVIK